MSIDRRTVLNWGTKWLAYAILLPIKKFIPEPKKSMLDMWGYGYRGIKLIDIGSSIELNKSNYKTSNRLYIPDRKDLEVIFESDSILEFPSIFEKKDENPISIVPELSNLYLVQEFLKKKEGKYIFSIPQKDLDNILLEDVSEIMSKIIEGEKKDWHISEKCIELSKSIVGEEKNIKIISKKIFDYMFDHGVRFLVEEKKNVDELIDQIQKYGVFIGDCTEFSELYQSLSLAAGIPVIKKSQKVIIPDGSNIGHSTNFLVYPMSKGISIVGIDTTLAKFMYKKKKNFPKGCFYSIEKFPLDYSKGFDIPRGKLTVRVKNHKLFK